MCIDTDDTSCDKYQAVAMRFDPFTTKWTKFLHGEPNCSSSLDAINTLCRESEREIANLLLANGNTVPFQGPMEQSLTLRREQRRDSSTGNSVRPESVVVATPVLTLSDTFSDNFANAEHLVEVTAYREPSVDNASVEEAVVEDVNEQSLAADPIPVSEEPGLVSEASETISSGWSTWGISRKDKKKKKAKFVFDEIPSVEEHPTEILAEEIPAEKIPAEEIPAEATVKESEVEREHPLGNVGAANDIFVEVQTDLSEPDVYSAEDNFGWGSFTKKDKKKFGQEPIAEQIEEQIPPPEPEPVSQLAEDFNWGLSKLSKKEKKKAKKGEALTEEEDRLPPEPVPEPADKWDDWGFSSISKKKKKGMNLMEEGEIPQADSTPEPADKSDVWAWPVSKKEKKGMTWMKEGEVPHADPAPELADDLYWNFSSTSKKKKKGGKLTEEVTLLPHEFDSVPPAELEPVSPPAEEYEQSKLDESPPPPPPAPSPPPSESRPKSQNSVLENGRSEAPLPPEFVGHPSSAPSFTAAATARLCLTILSHRSHEAAEQLSSRLNSQMRSATRPFES